MSEQADFPISTSIGGRHFFARHEVEAYKRKQWASGPPTVTPRRRSRS